MITNKDSGTSIGEIADGIRRIGTPVSVVPGGSTLNQHLIVETSRCHKTTPRPNVLRKSRVMQRLASGRDWGAQGFRDPKDAGCRRARICKGETPVAIGKCFRHRERGDIDAPYPSRGGPSRRSTKRA
jgi:hypothetical protein